MTDLVRHFKGGPECEVLHRGAVVRSSGSLRSVRGLQDGDRVVVYRGSDGQVSVMERSQFEAEFKSADIVGEHSRCLVCRGFILNRSRRAVYCSTSCKDKYHNNPRVRRQVDGRVKEEAGADSPAVRAQA